MGRVPPKAKKTGTTIAGCVFKGGVVLGADTRATSDSTVCDKNCEKIHFISKSIWCCGAGTSADTENTTALIASKLELMRLATGKEPRVVSAMTRLKQYLFQYQGHVSAALVLGGVDETGSYLYTIHPHGSVDQLPYATMGSGSLCAMAVFEAGYRDDMDEKEAVELVNQAIQSGIYNDLGSGGNVDICVIRQDSGEARMFRTYASPIPHIPRIHTGYNFPRGTTELLQDVHRAFREKILIQEGYLNEDGTVTAKMPPASPQSPATATGVAAAASGSTPSTSSTTAPMRS